MADRNQEPPDSKCVLHAAAGILQQEITKIRVTNEYYIPSIQMPLTACPKFVQELMYDFISWVTDETFYSDAAICNDPDTHKNILPAISLCHNIIAQSSGICTPITLGRGLYAHHEYGSRYQAISGSSTQFATQHFV